MAFREPSDATVPACGVRGYPSFTRGESQRFPSVRPSPRRTCATHQVKRPARRPLPRSVDLLISENKPKEHGQHARSRNSRVGPDAATRRQMAASVPPRSRAPSVASRCATARESWTLASTVATVAAMAAAVTISAWSCRRPRVRSAQGRRHLRLDRRRVRLSSLARCRGRSLRRRVLGMSQTSSLPRDGLPRAAASGVDTCHWLHNRGATATRCQGTPRRVRDARESSHKRQRC
jgi:hypothetical protein